MFYGLAATDACQPSFCCQVTAWDARRSSRRSIRDQSGAYAFSGTLQGLNFVVYVVLARFGTVVAGFDYGDIGSDVSGFEVLVIKASARIKAALPSSP
jgi:hypothetical protein